MLPKIERFLRKHSISPDDIKYIIRENGSTVVYTIDGRTAETYLPIKDFKESLPVEQFLHPNKGIIAAAAQIVDVCDGHYEMTDGRKFKFRVHNSAQHDSRLLALGRQFEHSHSAVNDALEARFSAFDKLPLPLYAVELQMKEGILSANLVFRYCNQTLLDSVGLTKEDIVGKNHYDFVPHVAPKHMAVYMDVALNGTSRFINEYDVAKNTKITACCFPPMPGYCACLLLDVTPVETAPA